MNDFTIEKSIYIDASPDAVFHALTSSMDIVRYFPLRKVTSEWEVGGEILLEGEADGAAFRDYGVIEAMSKPNQFKYSYWSDNHGTERTPENYLTIDYRLEPNQRGTTLNLKQGNLRAREMFLAMDAVWDHLLSSLAKYVETAHNH